MTAAELDALRLSLSVALRSVLVSLPFAVAIAYVLARGRLRGRVLLDAFVHLPLVLPPVVVGYLLLLVFGMRGPVGRWLYEQFGPDVIVNVGNILKMTSPGGSALDRMVASGKLGKKSGEGFYLWKDGKPQKVQPDKPWDRRELELLGRELVDPLIREAERVRDERIVESADLVDAGLVFGTGFAPFRGGPLHFAANEVRSNVEVLRRPAVA